MLSENQTTKQAYTPKEVAARWSLSVIGLRTWRANGVGPRFVKMGKAVRYLESDLIAFEEANKSSPGV